MVVMALAVAEGQQFQYNIWCHGFEITATDRSRRRVRKLRKPRPEDASKNCRARLLALNRFCLYAGRRRVERVVLLSAWLTATSKRGASMSIVSRDSEASQRGLNAPGT